MPLNGFPFSSTQHIPFLVGLDPQKGMKGDTEQQRGEDWRRIVVEALNVRWDEMHRPDWEEQSFILEAKPRSEAQQRSKLEELRKLEAELQSKAEELHQKAEELRREEVEQGRKDEELRGMAEKLRRMEEELHEQRRTNPNTSIADTDNSLEFPDSPRGRSRDCERPSSSLSRSSTESFVEIPSAVRITPQDLPGFIGGGRVSYRNKRNEERRPCTNQNTQIQPIVVTDKSVKRPGSSRGPSDDSEHQSSGRSGRLTISFVKLSSAVGTKLQLRKSPGKPEDPSSSSSEQPQEHLGSSSNDPTSDPLVRPSGRQTLALHIPSQVNDSEWSRAERFGFTGGGRRFRLSFD